MASTLAHELNQPLMALSNFAAAAQAFAEQGQHGLLVASLDDISAAGQRAGEIVARIRGFVRQRSGERRTVHAERGASPRCWRCSSRNAARARRARHWRWQPDLPAVRGDRVLLEQVLLNLVLNGLQATQHLARRAASCRSRRPRDGDSWCVRVADHGPGIRPEVAAQLFEPFFTSKADGLGLGLNICRTIIEGHGGHLGFENRAEGGAVFFFTLPPHHDPDPH